MITAVKAIFSRESVLAVEEEIKPLLFKHWQEIAHYKDIPLDPDWGYYKMLDEKGFLGVYTARENGVLIGYSIYAVKPNPHYKSSLQAHQDIIFIDPEKRGFGKEFIDWCDSELRSLGVQVVYHHVKKDHDFSPVLRRLGYALVDLIYARRLS